MSKESGMLRYGRLREVDAKLAALLIAAIGENHGDYVSDATWNAFLAGAESASTVLEEAFSRASDDVFGPPPAL